MLEIAAVYGAVTAVTTEMIDETHRIFALEEVNPASTYLNPRILALHEALLKQFGEPVRRYIDFGRWVCTIYDFLWPEIMPGLITLRDSGKSIANVWQPV